MSYQHYYYFCDIVCTHWPLKSSNFILFGVFVCVNLFLTGFVRFCNLCWIIYPVSLVYRCVDVHMKHVHVYEVFVFVHLSLLILVSRFPVFVKFLKKKCFIIMSWTEGISSAERLWPVHHPQRKRETSVEFITITWTWFWRIWQLFYHTHRLRL